jgi:HlyD family secretion protein
MTTPGRPDIHAVLGTGARPGRARRWTLALGVVAVLAVAGVAAVWSLGSGGNTVRYVTEPVTRGTLVVLVTATGSVQPTKKVDVSSEITGMIRRVLVDYNSPVTVGQVLAEIDTDKLNATVDNSRAKLAAARARVAEALATILQTERELTRKRTLAQRSIASAHDLDVAQATYDRAVAALSSAQADVGAAEAELRLNETNLAKAVVRSPINGVILKRNVDPGQTVVATMQAPVMFSIAEDLRQMELQIDVDEADVGKVRPGQTATFSVDAFADRKFPATIKDVRFASETIQGVVTYKAILVIDNSEMLLRPGMTATAEIRSSEVANALLIPNAALRYRPATVRRDQRGFLRRLMPGPPQRTTSPRDPTGPNRTVWVAGPDGPQTVPIVIGVSDGRRTEVREGPLAEGQAVIVDQAGTGR